MKHFYSYIFNFLFCSLMMLACSLPENKIAHSNQPLSDIKIQSRQEYLETAYSVSKGNCHVSVTTNFPESVNKDVARLRHQNCKNEDLLSNLLGLILKEIAKGNNGALPFNDFSMGRLVEYPSLSHQLTTFAINSDKWDSKKGRPRSGHATYFATQALNEILPSSWIFGVLSPYWKHPTVPSTEKVLVDPVSKLPFDCQFGIMPK